MGNGQHNILECKSSPVKDHSKTRLKKSQLEILLSECPKYVSPNASLEQYRTSPDIAAEILNTAYLCGDIRGKTVADLGCGTGIFAIGAGLLGAKHVIGIDIDPVALEEAAKWARRLNLNIEFLNSDISSFKRKVDTVISNPPFGVHTRHADQRFIYAGILNACKVYMLHYAPTEEFVRRVIRELGGVILGVKRYKCILHHEYPFHKEEKRYIEMVLIISKGCDKDEQGDRNR